MGVGDRIRRARMARGISATKLAEMIGKDRSTVYRYENGEVGGARVGILEPIAEALGTTPAALMGWTGEWDDPNAPSSARHGSRRIPVMSLQIPPNPTASAFLAEIADSYAPVGDFVITATGEAMGIDNIREGDLVFISEQCAVADGQIAAVIINRTMALMRAHSAIGGTTLVSGSPTIPPILLENTPSARVVGRAVAFQSML